MPRIPPPPVVRTPKPATWGPWEWRTIPRDFPHTPKGLIRACLNSTYSVQFFQHQTEWGLVDHLMIRRHDEQPIRSWSDMQAIKDDLMGPERVGVEVYPAAADLVDSANLYHLWILPVGMVLPFGLHQMERAVA